MTIISDSNTQLGVASASATPLFWAVNSLTDTASVLNTINALPERVTKTRFTTTSSAYLYLVSSSKYFPILGTQPLNTPVTDGLALYLNAGQLISYPTTASTWYDISGNNDSGSLLNGITYNNNALVFDGIDDNVLIESYISMSNPTTVCALINRSITSSGDQVFFGPYANGFDQWLSISNNVLSLRGTQAEDINNFQIYGNTIISSSRWYFTTGIINGPTSSIYLNGNLERSATQSFNIASWGGQARIGSRGTTQFPFPGKISNIQAYNKVLTQAEILQNYYQAPIVTNGLVMALDANNLVSYESGSSLAYSLTGSASGSLINGTGFTNNNGGAWNFDGVDDYINNIGTTSSFSFIQNTGIFTISSWVRLTDLSVARYFLGNNDGTTVAKGFYLGYDGLNGRLWLFITYGVGGQNTLSYVRSNFFTDNNWVLVTCVGNGTTCQFYKNGQIFESSGTFGTFSTGDSTRALSVGRINNFNSSYWQGNIAQTQIYNKALTAAEVSQNYNAQRSRFGL
jgi:hypothetical protein